MAVYFLNAPSVGRIKIGTAIYPEERILAIRLISPVPVELIGSIKGGYKEEKELHNKFSSLRRHGEWFESSNELTKFIEFKLLLSAWEAARPEARDEFLKEIGER